jgi:hypothetical protein
MSFEERYHSMEGKMEIYAGPSEVSCENCWKDDVPVYTVQAAHSEDIILCQECLLELKRLIVATLKELDGITDIEGNDEVLQ